MPKKTIPNARAERQRARNTRSTNSEESVAAEVYTTVSSPEYSRACSQEWLCGTGYEGEASPVVPSQARCIPQPPWLTALLVVKVYPQPLLVVRWGCTALDISRHASARYNPHPHRTRVDSFAFQDQHHVTKSTEMVVPPNSTACSTDSKQLKRVVFYSCGRTSPPDLHGILLGSPTPRCEG